MDIIQKILDYINHVENIAYAEEILTSNPIEAVLDTIREMLETRQGDELDSTCMFIRDVMIMMPSINQEFTEQFFRSAALPALERLLFSEDYSNRYNALYTLAKIFSRGSVGALYKAFDQFIDHDPFMMPRLLFELRWLGERNLLPLIERLIFSEKYLTRWSALRQLEPVNVERMDPVEQGYLQRLSEDEHRLVRAEANYEYHKVEKLKHIAQLPKQQQKAAYKLMRSELKPINPPLTFGSLEIMVMKHFKRTFTYEALEQFVDSLVL